MTEPAVHTAKAAILGVIESATEITRELLVALRHESQALAAMRLTAPVGFAEAKGRLVIAYQYKLEELRECPMVPEAETALATLKELNVEVMAAARTNAAVLQGAITGSTRLLEIVIKAMAQRQPPPAVGYSRVGNHATLPRRSATSGSVMFTRRL